VGSVTRHIVAIGDVGVASAFHVGDEAMLEAALAEVGARQDVRWTVVSAQPAESARRYGVSAVPRLGFAGLTTPQEREDRLTAVTAAATGGDRLAADDPAQALLDAVAAADAVLVTGGGNLTSTWPEHVYERAALAAVAAARRTPLVVTGQGLGPQLAGRDGELVSAALTGAQLVGVREEASADLARRLGVPADRVRCTVDDAAFLADAPVPGLLEQLGTRPGGFVAATFSESFGWYPATELVAPLAALLDEIAERTGRDVLLTPHVGTPDEAPTHDLAFHEALVGASRSGRVSAAPLLASREVAWLTRQAALVVSSRYHPVVFGLSAGVPSVAVAVDDYTEQKLRGVLALAGLESWCVSVLGLRSGVLRDAVLEAWDRRDELAGHLRQVLGPLRQQKADYWDAVSAALAGGSGAPPAGDPAPASAEAGAQGPWTARNADALHATRLFAARRGDWERERCALHGAAVAARAQAHEAREAAAAALDEVATLTEMIDAERAASDAVRELNAELWRGRGHHVAELEAMHRTKIMRWTRVPRAVYGAVRETRA
jgi:polysaccharide pyruvyl transferase WcaK-like protein